MMKKVNTSLANRLKTKIKMIIAKKMRKFLKKPSKTLKAKRPKTRPANLTQRVVERQMNLSRYLLAISPQCVKK